MIIEILIGIGLILYPILAFHYSGDIGDMGLFFESVIFWCFALLSFILAYHDFKKGYGPPARR